MLNFHEKDSNLCGSGGGISGSNTAFCPGSNPGPNLCFFSLERFQSMLGGCGAFSYGMK